MKRGVVGLEGLLPAIVMASGVALLTAGLLAYAPSAFGDASTPRPAAGDPLFGGVSSGPNGSPLDIGSPSPATLEPGANRPYATRIRIPSLRIDLPVVSGDLTVPGYEGSYPLCDVAMFLPTFSQPGEPGTTYLYAHAQRDMFLPLLRASEIDDGAALLGGLVEVYASDDELHLYEIVRVKRHATDLSLATEAGHTAQLVLQTSEGPTGTIPKLQVAAMPVSVIRAETADAQPSPQPRVCTPSE